MGRKTASIQFYSYLYGKLEKLRDNNYCHIFLNYYEETLNNYSNSPENRGTKKMHLSCKKKKLQLATK